MKLKQQVSKKAYTLVETLIASAIIMLAVGAASKLSLAMVTQEESAERATRAANYLENAATLYRLGLETTEIQSVLPNEPTVISLSITPGTENVTGVGDVDIATLSIEFSPSGSTSATTADQAWTGGDSDAVRTETVRVMR